MHTRTHADAYTHSHSHPLDHYVSELVRPSLCGYAAFVQDLCQDLKATYFK